MLPRTRTSLYASYLLASTLKLWNSLPPEIKDCPSISILKSKLTSRVDHDKVPKYYYYGPRLTQILHARLRMRSSSLNEHLYIKNIIDSPNCFCGEIESTHHYLFKCPKYTRQRKSFSKAIAATEHSTFGKFTIIWQPRPCYRFQYYCFYDSA